MDAQERQEIRDLRDRILKLETIIELEFRHLREDLKTACISINKLNEEYGHLIQRQANLEVKSKEVIGYWKLASLVIAPIVTTVFVLIIHFIFGF